MSGITDPTEAYFKDGAWGWDGSQWRKLTLVWGYSDRYSERETEDNVAAGTHYLTFTAVPAGEVWVVTAYTGYCTTANPVAIRLGVIQAGVELIIAQQMPVTASLVLAMTGQLVLKESDYLRIAFVTCILNDDLRGYAVGYKMKIAE